MITMKKNLCSALLFSSAKNWVLVGILTLCSTNIAYAQYEEGQSTIQPRIGMTFSNLTGGDKMKVDPTLGMEYEYYVNDRFSLAAGVLFTNQGTKYDFYDEKNRNQTAKINIYYGALPITANYYLLRGLAVKAGIQPAFRVKANLKMDGANIDFDSFVDTVFEGENNTMNKFDLSIPVGLSYEFFRVTLDARYNIGVTNLIKGDNIHQKVLVVTLGYKF